MSNVFDSLADGNLDGRETNSDRAQPSPAETAAVHQPLVDDSKKQSAAISRAIKEVTQQLLKNGYLEESRKADLFRRAVTNRDVINTVLEPLDLVLQVDAHRGVAFLKVAVGPPDAALTTSEAIDDAWSHPLVRRQRLTLEQSILLAILRQVFVMHEQESGVGESAAKVAVDELMPHFSTYFEDSGSDAKNESRLLNLLDHLKAHGIVSEVDKNQEVTIRPLIAHVANPESLLALLRTLKQHGNATDEKEGSNE